MSFLYLYPDVHVWSDGCRACFFDTRCQKQSVYVLDHQSRELVKALKDVRNLYCIQLTQKTRNLAIVSSLVENGFGLIVSCAYDERPVAIPPFHMIDYYFSEKLETYNYRILDYVKQVTIHCEEDCQHHCSNCSFNYRQIPHCTISKQALRGNTLDVLVSRIHALKNLEIINFIITTFNKSLFRFASLLHKESVLSLYYVSWNNVSMELIKTISAQESSLIKIIIDLSEIPESQLNQMCEIQKQYHESVILVFCVTDKSDLNTLEIKHDGVIRENTEIRCIYTGKEKSHIIDKYLLNDSELQELNADHNSIFRNREFNTALFGNLVIHPDGTVRLNENTEVIGTIEDDWTDMLNKALNKPNPWLMTRNKIEPCSYCIYRDLCPPIRNLELYMGDKLACVDYYKSLVKPEKDNN